MKWMKERRGLDHSFTALEAKFIRLPLGLFIPRLRERSVWLAGQRLRPPHPFPLPQHQEGVGGEGVNRRERPPRAAAAAPAADGALGYCLPPPAGLNKIGVGRAD